MKRLLGVLVASLIAGDVWAADYVIDPAHSSVVFKVKHLAISSVPGRFGDVSGKFSFDPSKIDTASAEATIKASTINTMDAKRDDHLKGADFLEVSKFPVIQFQTTRVEKISDTTFNAHGDLSIHGVAKPVVLNVTYGGSAKDPWGKERAAFEAKTTINRKDFGLTWSKALETGGLVVGDDVQITLEIEGVKA